MQGIGCFILAVVNLIISLLDWEIINFNAEYMCVENWFYEPTNGSAALILLIKSIIDFAGTVIVWWILFAIPLYQGKVANI